MNVLKLFSRSLILFSAILSGAAFASDPKISTVLESSKLKNYQVSARFVEVDSGRVIYDRGGDDLVIPASTLKLFTTAAALKRLGPAHQFKTEVLSTGKISKGVLEGDLWIKGGGDPGFVSENLFLLVQSIRAAGIKSIKGSIRFDQSQFATPRVRQPRVKQDLTRAFNAPYGALNLNYNALSLVVRPGSKLGEAAILSSEPQTPFLILKNEVRTAKTTSLSWHRNERRGFDEWVVRGTIALGAPQVQRWVSVSQPAPYFVATLSRFLDDAGIQAPRFETSPGEVPSSAKRLTLIDSKPLSEIVTLLNKYSNNFMAQVIANQIGFEAIEEEIKRYRKSPEKIELASASGIERDDRVSAGELVGLLKDVQKEFGFAPEFTASLPIAGKDGTLDDRFEDRDFSKLVLRAKTGMLSGVSSLAGFYQRKGEPLVAFAVLVNAPGFATTPDDTRFWQGPLLDLLAK